MGRLLLALALLCVAAGAVVAWLRLDHPVRNVMVDGTLNVAEQIQIRDTVAANLSGGLLGADLARITTALYDLSWPRHVSVRRIWPDTLEIRVDKAMVVALWDDGLDHDGGFAHLTGDGRVVSLARREPGLVAFACTLSAPRAAMDLYQRLQPVAADGDLHIRRLEENALGEWRVVFDGVAVVLGASEQAARLERFVHVYTDALAGRRAEIAEVDARYANGVAVRWRPDMLATVRGDAVLAGLEEAQEHERAEHGFGH